MARTRQEGDFHVTGHLTGKTMGIPAGTLTNAGVNGSAAIATTKMRHQYIKVYAQESATSAADGAEVIHIAHGATGTIVGFAAGSVVANVGAATVTVDLLKNGTTVLSAVITLDSANTNYVVEDGTVNTTAYVDDDVLEVVIDGTAGGGTLALGVFAKALLREDPA